MTLSELALKCIHIPYQWGGQNPLEGFDCSGFARYLLRSVGVLPECDLTAQGIHDQLKRQAEPTAITPTEGAFLFFGKSKNHITHVAYALSDKLMIEAYGDSRVTTHIAAEEYQSHDGAIVRINPINRRQDLQAIIRPVYKVLGE